jgi:hypothetical protein
LTPVEWVDRKGIEDSDIHVDKPKPEKEVSQIIVARPNRMLIKDVKCIGEGNEALSAT